MLTLGNDGRVLRVTANQDKYTVTTAELSQRREFVKGVRSKIQSIREDLSGGYGAAKGVRQKHEELVGSKKEQAELDNLRHPIRSRETVGTGVARPDGW